MGEGGRSPDEGGAAVAVPRARFPYGVSAPMYFAPSGVPFSLS
jgi:hypothetical protein